MLERVKVWVFLLSLLVLLLQLVVKTQACRSPEAQDRHYWHITPIAAHITPIAAHKLISLLRKKLSQNLGEDGKAMMIVLL
ncbi:uncharacterized protein YALI1_D11068g [Yarrowia lipolytica]|uniref:Uncharacterized protein n=1 Tax=Yarrowia lipolytica TaxID=4952 RepID=A0A1D8NDU9_YARLL|nr:hypothetical protein YALI1_D11068g [Yarrowia lipolytica]